nr:MAG TPA: RimK-related lysine biosynthesis protein, Probable-dependent amine/thiol ligase family Amino-group [Bacteriophage sp.]
MVEYLKRDDALRALEQINPVDYGAMWDYEAHHYAGECLRDCKEAIDSIPAADVAPVIHARWDDSGRYTFPGGGTAVRCTECGCALTVSEYHLNNWNYCPVCGAKMDGGADNEA